ncbi:MAG: hypothetical protein IKF17_05675 [Clostridia bacterium]|nr:hypothetical protein [Clostridia bacterium]
MNGCYYNDEIKVGELIRTEFGGIGKFYRSASESPDVYCLYTTKSDGLKYSTRYDSITKHSEDIKDLLEIKDVIHYRIDNISTTLETKGYIESIVDIKDEEMLKSIKENQDYHILEILTKEKWNQTAYKVKE